MRITSGIHGGRVLRTPKNMDVRPTSDKVRAAIFNALNSRGAVQNAKALDLFCGTGALGLEALSQGADDCTFIDKNRTSLDLAKDNAKALNEMSRSTFSLSDATKLMPRTSDDDRFDLVFMDPPYDQDLAPKTLSILTDGGWLAPAAFIIIEAEKTFSMLPPEEFTLAFEKTYGDTKVISLIAPE